MWSMNEIREANEQAGKHFFDRDALKFFDSEIYEPVYEGVGGVYFITSEQFDKSTKRLFTIREFNPETSSVNTFGKFQQYRSLADAKEAAESICKTEASA